MRGHDQRSGVASFTAEVPKGRLKFDHFLVGHPRKSVPSSPKLGLLESGVFEEAPKLDHLETQEL